MNLQTNENGQTAEARNIYSLKLNIIFGNSLLWEFPPSTSLPLHPSLHTHPNYSYPAEENHTQNSIKYARCFFGVFFGEYF